MNEERLRRDIVTIGASAGGVEAIVAVLERLPADLPAAIGIVLHRSPVFGSHLAALFQRKTTLKAVEPEDGDRVELGYIYIAPRDQHMRFIDGKIRLDRGAKQHFTRPAVDPLFVGAAQTYGSRVVGVVLSGGGADGVSGLIAIKAAGGLSIVQVPWEAGQPSMPTRSIANDDVDAILDVDSIGDALVALAHGDSFTNSEPDESPSNRWAMVAKRRHPPRGRGKSV